MVLVVIAAVWKQMSYNFLFFLAGLQSIPTLADRGRRHRRRRARCAASGPSCSRCCRPPPSSCWWSTWSTPSSTPSRSSTPPPQGGPGKATAMLVYKVYFDGFRGLDFGSLGGAIGGADGHRHRTRRWCSSATSTARSTTDVRPEPSRPGRHGRAPSLAWVSWPTSSLLLRRGAGGVPDLPGLRRRPPTRAQEVRPRRRCRCCPAAPGRTPTSAALFTGSAAARRGAPVGRMMWVSLVDGAGHLAWARSPSRCCRPSRWCTSASRRGNCLLLDDLHHADAAGRGAHRARPTRSWPAWACSTAMPA